MIFEEYSEKQVTFDKNLLIILVEYSYVISASVIEITSIIVFHEVCRDT